MEKHLSIAAPDGSIPTHVFHPDGDGPWPAVIMYMDGIGIRPALADMARKIAARGYYVILPDLYYRQGPWTPLVPADAFREGPQRDQMLNAMGQLTNGGVAGDSAALLDFIRAQDQTRGQGVSCVGYCMGGAHALTAAANHPDQISTVCVFHGARLVTDRPDSPHLLLPRIKARLYVGVAGIDPWLAPDEMTKFEAALAAAGTDYTMETYPDVKHGFAVTDTPAHDAQAAQRHWARLFATFEASNPH